MSKDLHFEYMREKAILNEHYEALKQGIFLDEPNRYSIPDYLYEEPKQ